MWILVVININILQLLYIIMLTTTFNFAILQCFKLHSLTTKFMIQYVYNIVIVDCKHIAKHYVCSSIIFVL